VGAGDLPGGAVDCGASEFLAQLDDVTQ
jgi:hypothetical protein